VDEGDDCGWRGECGWVWMSVNEGDEKNNVDKENEYEQRRWLWEKEVGVDDCERKRWEKCGRKRWV